MTKLRGSTVVVVSAALLLAGCGGGSDSEKKAADPKAALASSTSGLKAGNYAFTEQSPQAHMKGAVDVASKSAAAELESTAKDGPGKVEMRLVDVDRWVRIQIDMTKLTGDLSSAELKDPTIKRMIDGFKQMFDGKSWLHADASRLKNSKDLNLDLSQPDLTGATKLLSGVVTAEGDAHRVTGTLDATKASGDLGGFDDDDIKGMGAAAQSLPYVAQLDDQGRLTHLELTVPKSGDVPAGKWVIDVTGYGTQPAQTKPTGPVKEMPESAYQALGS